MKGRFNGGHAKLMHVLPGCCPLCYVNSYCVVEKLLDMREEELEETEDEEEEEDGQQEDPTAMPLGGDYDAQGRNRRLGGGECRINFVRMIRNKME